MTVTDQAPMAAQPGTAGSRPRSPRRAARASTSPRRPGSTPTPDRWWDPAGLDALPIPAVRARLRDAITQAPIVHLG
jgi:hypothetical protein